MPQAYCIKNSGTGERRGGDRGCAGHTAHPKPSWWTAQLGRSWSLDYFETIVPFPTASRVFLVTRWARFREFRDANADGLYETSIPGDEYRQLEKTPIGWELHGLDGMVDSFDNSGRWTQRGGWWEPTAAGVWRKPGATMPAATSC